MRELLQELRWELWDIAPPAAVAAIALAMATLVQQQNYLDAEAYSYMVLGVGALMIVGMIDGTGGWLA